MLTTTPDSGNIGALESFGRRRYVRFGALALTGLLLLMAGWSWVEPWPLIAGQWGNDYDFFMDVTRRWLSNGQFYQPHQLEGPYEAAINVDTLYPPIALLLFVPFVWLPAILWWVIPLGIVAWTVVWARPAVWVWPVLALMVWFPRTQSIIVWGNTTMWIAAFVALGIWYRPLAAFVLLKPTFAPFALMGMRSRGWWFACALLASLTIPMVGDYIAALVNNVGSFPGLNYSIQDIPFVAIPLISWAAGRRPPAHATTDGATAAD